MVAGSLSSVQSCLGQTDHYANYVINIEGQVFFPVNFAELLIMRTEELTSLMGQTNCCGRGQQEGPAVCTAQHCGPLGETVTVQAKISFSESLSHLGPCFRPQCSAAAAQSINFQFSSPNQNSCQSGRARRDEEK